MTKTIAVCGATGNQGGGVVTALLKKGFHVRALTRSTTSEKAKALAAKDSKVELVQAELSDKASLVKAFTGVDGVFLMTDFFTVLNFDKEVEQGTTAIAAAKEAKVPFVLFSTLEDTKEALQGKGIPEAEPGHYVSHFDSKALVGEKLKESGLPWAALLPCAFYDNSLTMWYFQKQDDGTVTFSDNLGTSKVGWHAVADIGESAAVVFEDPKKYMGKTIPVVGELLSMNSAADTLSKISGKTVKYNQMPDKVYAGFGFPGAEDVANMFAYYRESPLYTELRPLDQRVYEGPTFEEWANYPANKETLFKKINSL